MYSTRRFELGLPLFSGLDLGQIMSAQAQIEKGDFKGLTEFIATLGVTGQTRTIRKLAAIYNATDLELKLAEADPKVMAELEEKAAEMAFPDSFRAAMDFQSALWESLGVSPVSSEAPAEPKPGKGRKAKTSEGSQSEG